MQRPGARELVLFVVVASCLSTGVLSTAVLAAAEFRSDERALVSSDEVIEDDLYIFGDEVTIDGEIKGDAIVFGRVIHMNGSVRGDLIAAGQAIVIRGSVADDVRMAGQILKIDKDASIADDVIAAGFSLEIVAGSAINGDLMYGGYQGLVGGSIGGRVKGAMANCEVSGSIVGDADLSVEGDAAGARGYTAGSPPPVSFPDVPAGLTIRDTARIGGALEYRSRQEAEIAAGARITGEIRHERPHDHVPAAPTPGQKVLRVLGQYGALLIIGLVVLLVAPRPTRRLADNIRARPFASLGFGVVGIVGFVVLLIVIPMAIVAFSALAGLAQLTGLVPVIIVLGFSSCVMLVVGFWFFTSYLSSVVLGFFAGSWLLGRVKPSLGENRFLALLVGVATLAVISIVPYLGALVGGLVVLLALGALVGWMFRQMPAPAQEA